MVVGVVDTTTASYDVNPSRLANGQHTFYVKAIDEAGNCQTTATSFEVWVDDVAEMPGGLSVFTDASETTPVAESTWQTDNTVRVRWTDTSVEAPQVGYNVGLTDPGCGTPTDLGAGVLVLFIVPSPYALCPQACPPAPSRRPSCRASVACTASMTASGLTGAAPAQRSRRCCSSTA